MKKSFLLLVIFCSSQIFAQPKTDKKLDASLHKLIEGFRGDVGVYVKSLNDNKIASVNADSVFPTASMIKVTILTGIFDKIEKGELQFHQELIYKDSLLYAGVDLLGSFKSGEKIELSKLLMLMLTMSDNTASLWLQTLAGTGTRINEILDSLGCKITRVNSRTPGREANRQMYGWGQTTPAEMATLFEKIYKQEVISKKASEKMLRLLGRNYWDEVAISQIPPYIFVASKSGAVDDSRSETMLVMAPHHPFVFSIITKNQKDTTWELNNAGWVLARKLTRILYNHFEPQSNWEPALNAEGK